jgi:hypothetical protein
MDPLFEQILFTITKEMYEDCDMGRMNEKEFDETAVIILQKTVAEFMIKYDKIPCWEYIKVLNFTNGFFIDPIIKKHSK